MAMAWHSHGMAMAMAWPWHGMAMAWQEIYPFVWGNDCAARQEIAVHSGLEGSQTPKREHISKKYQKNSRSTAPSANML
jgi:hypothetical protein